MVKGAGKMNVRELKIYHSQLEPLVSAYEDALKELPEVLLVNKIIYEVNH